MNLSTMERTSRRSQSGTPARSRGIRLDQAVAPIDPVEFTAPDNGDDAAEQHPGADRSAENMRTLRTPFAPSPAEAHTGA